MTTRNGKRNPIFFILLLEFAALAVIMAMQSTSADEIGGNITEDVVLDLSGSPWLVTDDVTVFTDIDLIILPGVEIQLSHTTSIDGATGRIIAEGTSGDPIVFKRIDNVTSDPQKLRGVNPGINGSLGHCIFDGVRIEPSTGSVISDCKVGNLEWAGIVMRIRDVKNIRLIRCHVYDCDVGIIIQVPSGPINNVTIIDCFVEMCRIGYEFNNNYNNISLINCTALNCKSRSFFFGTGGRPGKLTVEYCKAFNSPIGFEIKKYHNFTLYRCLAQGCRGFGIYAEIGIYEVPSYIRNCIIEDCGVGIYFHRHEKMFITENTFRNNRVGLNMTSTWARDHYVWKNNFINNSRDAQIWNYVWNVEWDVDGEGNYWDDYSGPDNDSDGTGDTPYSVWGEYEDSFPLMEPRDNTAPIAEAGPPLLTTVGGFFELDGSLSSDDQGIVGWEWRLYHVEGTAFHSGTVFNRSIQTVGRYLATLRVQDAHGGTGWDTTWIDVRDMNPPIFIGDFTNEGFHRGDETEFNVQFQDDIGVASVFLDLRFASGDNWTSFGMMAENGYHKAFVEMPTTGTFVEYRFRAVDINRNWATSDAVESELLGARPYIITDPLSEAWEGTPFEQFFEVEDIDGFPNEHEWLLDTDASWLFLDDYTGVASGIPGHTAMGTYWVNVSVFDLDGFSDWIRYEIVVFRINVPPEVVISSPENGTTVADMLIITGRADDVDSPVDSVKVRVDEGEWMNAEGTDVWSIELNTRDLKPGVYRLEVYATDNEADSDIVTISFIKPKDADDNDTIMPFIYMILIALIIISVGTVAVITMRRVKRE